MTVAVRSVSLRQTIQSQLRWRYLPVQLGVLATFLLTPVWYRFEQFPGFFASLYISKFAILIPLMFTVLAWLVTGLPGFAAFRQSGIRTAWAMALLALPIWMYASGSWAFMGGQEGLMEIDATTAAVQFGAVVLFAIAAASAGPSPSAVITVLVIGLVWNTLLGGAQVALQSSVGLSSIGEFPLSLGQPGISVVQANGIRWLRPYGLLPHPNIFAAVFIVGLLTLVYGLTAHRGWLRVISLIILMPGLWVFLLTFSRGAYLALLVGAFVLLPLLWRIKRADNGLGLAVIVSLLVMISFGLVYRPFLLARTGAGLETTELYSAGERSILTQTAYRSINDNLLVGVGAANFPWRASYYLNADNSPVRGNNVHNVLLSVWAELGLIGLVIFVIALLFGMEAVIQRLRAGDGDTAGRAVLVAGFVALVIAGLFEYYPYTLLQMQVLWWGILAVAMQPVRAE